MQKEYIRKLNLKYKRMVKRNSIKLLKGEIYE